MERKLDTNDPPEPRFSLGDRQRNRAYYRRFVPAMVVYMVLLIAARQMELDTTAKRLAFVAVPVVPAALTVWAVWRNLRSSDEYQRLTGYWSMSVGFAAAMVAAVVMAFVGIAFKGDVDPDLGAWVTFASGMGAWLVAALVVARRA